MAPNRLRLWMLRTLAIVTSLALGYVLMDAVLWLVAPLPEGYVIVHTYQQNTPGLKPSVTIRSQFGLRARSLQSVAKPANTIRVFCLGASTTEQIGQNIDDTWTGLLEQRLRQAFPTVPIEVAAWGAGGRRATAAVRYARSDLGAFDPDVVVTLFGINDLCWSGGPGYHPGDIPTEVPTPSTLSIAPPSRIFRWSQIARRLGPAVENLHNLRLIWSGRAVSWEGQQMPALRKKYHGFPEVEHPTRPNDPYPDFDAAMRLLLDELHYQGRPTLVLGQPTLWRETMTDAERAALWFWLELPSGPIRPSTEWLLAEMQRYNAAQRNRAGEFGAAYLDLDAQIPKDLAHYYDDCHFTDLGSRTVADAVFPALKTAVESAIAKRRLRSP